MPSETFFFLLRFCFVCLFNYILTLLKLRLMTFFLLNSRLFVSLFVVPFLPSIHALMSVCTEGLPRWNVEHEEEEEEKNEKKEKQIYDPSDHDTFYYFLRSFSLFNEFSSLFSCKVVF